MSVQCVHGETKRPSAGVSASGTGCSGLAQSGAGSRPARGARPSPSARGGSHRSRRVGRRRRARQGDRLPGRGDSRAPARAADAPGPSGYEGPRRRSGARPRSAFAEVTRRHARLVGRACRRHGGGPLLAIVGHIDEIGLVRHARRREGFLFFRGVGGWRPEVLLGQRVEVLTRDGRGPRRDRVQGRKRAEARREAEQLELEDLHIDIGARDRDEALERRADRRRRRARRRARRAAERAARLALARQPARRLRRARGGAAVAEAGGAPGRRRRGGGRAGGGRRLRRRAHERLRARAAGRARGRRDRRDRHPGRRPEGRRRGEARRRPDRRPRPDDQPQGLRAARRDGRGGGDRATRSRSRPATRTPTWTPSTRAAPGSRPAWSRSPRATCTRPSRSSRSTTSRPRSRLVAAFAQRLEPGHDFTR